MTQPVSLPFGMRKIRLTPYTTDAATVLGTPIDLPYSRTLSFTEAEEFSQLRGDDRTLASHGSGPVVNWELESGGVPFEAIKAMYGGTVSETGVTPNRVKKYRKSANHTRPYFKIEGQSISDSGGDFHLVIWRAKSEGELTGTMGDGEFWLTGASGIGMPCLIPGADIDIVWDWVQNETVTAPA